MGEHPPEGRAIGTTDQFVANAEPCAGALDKGDVPLPPASHMAVLAHNL